MYNGSDAHGARGAVRSYSEGQGKPCSTSEWRGDEKETEGEVVKNLREDKAGTLTRSDDGATLNLCGLLGAPFYTYMLYLVRILLLYVPATSIIEVRESEGKKVVGKKLFLARFNTFPSARGQCVRKQTRRNVFGRYGPARLRLHNFRAGPTGSPGMSGFGPGRAKPLRYIAIAVFYAPQRALLYLDVFCTHWKRSEYLYENNTR